MSRSVKSFILAVALLLSYSTCVTANEGSSQSELVVCDKVKMGPVLQDVPGLASIDATLNGNKIIGFAGPFMTTHDGDPLSKQQAKIVADKAELVIERWVADNDIPRFELLKSYAYLQGLNYDLATDIYSFDVEAYPVGIMTFDVIDPNEAYRIYIKSKLDGNEIRSNYAYAVREKGVLHGLIETLERNGKVEAVVQWMYDGQALDRCEVQDVQWQIDGVDVDNLSPDSWIFETGFELYKDTDCNSSLDSNCKANNIKKNTQRENILPYDVAKISATAKIYLDNNGNIVNEIPSESQALNYIFGRLATKIKTVRKIQETATSGDIGGHIPSEKASRSNGCDIGIAGFGLLLVGGVSIKYRKK